MNFSPHSPQSTAEEQAALWTARLDGSSFTAADRDALNAWLAEKPENRSLLSQYCKVSANLEQDLPLLVAAGAVSIPEQVFAKPSSSRWKMISIVTLTTAAAVASIAIWPAIMSGRVQNLTTAVGQRQSFTLADGTRVELNAHTSLQVDNGRAERRVHLTDGEAFFMVSKDKTRPFIVETPTGSVRVTGTTFDVHTEAGKRLDVTVVEGSVQVRAGDIGDRAGAAPVSLGVGDQFSADVTGVTQNVLSSSALEDALAWRQGQIVLNATPLRDALARFAHYHGRGIVATSAAAELRVSGRYSLDDLDGFFSAIEDVLSVRVTRDLSGTVQVSLRTEH